LLSASKPDFGIVVGAEATIAVGVEVESPLCETVAAVLNGYSCAFALTGVVGTDLFCSLGAAAATATAAVASNTETYYDTELRDTDLVKLTTYCLEWLLYRVVD
jgi:hypothetical protein